MPHVLFAIPPAQDEPSTARLIHRLAYRDGKADVDDYTVLWDHTFYEIEVDGPDDPLAFAWVFNDGSVLYQPEWSDTAQVVARNGKICGPGAWNPSATVWPVPPDRILFLQRCEDGRVLVTAP